MKKISLSIIALLAASFAAFSQDTVTFKKFDIGPFEVVDEDYSYRLRDGVDIPEYFGLKKPFEKNTFQVGLFFSLPGARAVSTYGIDFTWKRKLRDKWFLNVGASAAVPSARAGVYDNGVIKDGISSHTVSLYLGVPVSAEYMCGTNSLLSCYFSLGLTPGGYFNGAFKADVQFADGDPMPQDDYRRPGFFLAPRADAGVYIPIGGHYVRAGIHFEYKIDLTDSNVEDRFRYGIGRFLPAIDLGFVF